MKVEEVKFKGYLVIPNTDIKTYSITPNNGYNEIEVYKGDIVIHSIYVSHDNPVAVVLTMKPVIPVPNKELEFSGVFENDVKTVPFHPPIGIIPQGKLYVEATGTNADQPIYLVIQYSKAYEGDLNG